MRYVFSSLYILLTFSHPRIVLLYIYDIEYTMYFIPVTYFGV